MSHRHQLGVYLGSSNCSDAACSCYRPRTGTRRTSSLVRGGSKKLVSMRKKKWLRVLISIKLTYKGHTCRSSRTSQSSNHASRQDRWGNFWHSCCRLLASEQCPAKTRKVGHGSLPQSIGKLGRDTHLRLGIDRLFDIGHGRTKGKRREVECCCRTISIEVHVSYMRSRSPSNLVNRPHDDR
jgi:hypothetical protein